MIQLDDVCFAYDDRPILSHLTETIEPGQAVLLSGPNGSGKSTLLRLLNGLIFPQQGTYSFDGTIITAGKMRDHAYSKCSTSAWVTSGRIPIPSSFAAVSAKN